MRNLEKGILLAELINPDLPSLEQIKNLVAWIREQDCYINLLNNMNEIKKSSTLLAQALYDEFRSLDLDRVNTIEEGLISYAKILYLCQISTPNFYVNPLLVLNKEERDIKLDDVIVKFNEKYITLGELALDEEFSFDQKYEFIKNQVHSWQEDVYERIQKPGQFFKNNNPRNLPKIRVMSFSHILLTIIYLGLLSFVIFGFTTNHEVLNTIFKNFDYHSFGPRNYFFIGFLFFFVIGILDLLIETSISYFKYHKYSKCRKIIIEKDDRLVPYINKQGERLQDYILNSIENKTKMIDNVFKYSSCLTLYEYVLYLYHVNYRCQKLTKNKMTTFAWYILLFNLLFIALLFASIIY